MSRHHQWLKIKIKVYNFIYDPNFKLLIKSEELIRNVTKFHKLKKNQDNGGYNYKCIQTLELI